MDSQVPAHLNGLRLDQTLAILFPDYSRSRLQTWIQAGKVQVDGNYLRSKDKVQTGQLITLSPVLDTKTSWLGQPIPLKIVYEDAELLVVNKPAGLVVHPATGNPDQTLVNALLYYAPELAAIPRAGIVHRLDKDTSGLLVVARTLTAHTHLVTQIQTHCVKREYIAVVNGTLIAGGTVDAPIGRHPTQRLRMAVIPLAKSAVTHYRILERFRTHTALQIFLETGRTHQIRVHMAYKNYPLIGDKLYGYRPKPPAQSDPALALLLTGFKRQALHAKRLTFLHPITKIAMQFQSPLPDDITQLMLALRNDTFSNR